MPEGESVWEMGVDRDISGKANDDNAKRMANPLGKAPLDTTFVFVTPRRWSGKDAWVQARNAEGTWKEVRVYDADDLATWLETAPSVHLWLSWLIGILPPGAQSLDGWWSDWIVDTNPVYTPALVLGGRDTHAQQIVDWLQASPSPLQLRANSQEEALAFFAATVEGLGGPLRETILARSVVVQDSAQWKALSLSAKPLILVPTVEGINAMAAVRRGHHVLLPLGNDTPEQTQGINLPRARRRDLETQFREIGLAWEKSRDYAALGRRSFGALRRALAVAGAPMTPSWARNGSGRVLLAALLAGTWDDSNLNDREILQRIADKAYDEFADEMVRWSNVSDPPVRRTGGIWTFLARREGWLLLARSLKSDDVERIQSTLLNAFQTLDTTYELESDKRHAAGIYGYGHPLSGHLRLGLARGLALIAAYSETVPLPNAPNAQSLANYVVRELLAYADWMRWASLSAWLPLLAEAAPEEFLEAVERSLGATESSVMRLFSEEDKQGFGRSPHTGLLWALETLAWSPQHFTRATLALARLTRLDPGGRLGNRPGRSLGEIFVLWTRHTSATFAQRFEALDVMQSREPEVAWSLLLSLLPSHHATSSPPHRPAFRDWMDEAEEGVLIRDLVSATTETVSRVVEWAKSEPSKWPSVLSRIGSLGKDDFALVLQGLTSLDLEEVDTSLRASIWSALREVIAHHLPYPDAEWSLSAEQVQGLQKEYERLRPTGRIEASRWLFAKRVALIPEEEFDRTERQEQLFKERTVAIEGVYNETGIGGLQTLSASVEEPGNVGFVVGRTLKFSDDVESEIVQAIELSNETPGWAFAAGYVNAKAFEGGEQWVRDRLSSEGIWRSSAAVRGQLFLALPSQADTWRSLEFENEEVQSSYWNHKSIWDDGTLSVDDHLHVIEQRVKYVSNLSALDFIESNERGERARVSPLVILELLEQALNDDRIPAESWHDSAHMIGDFLDLLTAAPEVADERVAALEFQFIKLLEHYREPKLLHKALSTDPSALVESLKIVFKGRHEEHTLKSEEEGQRAKLVFDLLYNWRTMPGLNEAGEVEADILNAWVDKVRELATACDRIELADQFIGKVVWRTLRDAPEGWPHPAVSAMIERVASEDIEQGMSIDIRNSRGVTMRDPESGGDQERALAATYRGFADKIRYRYPRTAGVLDDVAESYIHQGKREDERGELQEDHDD